MSNHDPELAWMGRYRAILTMVSVCMRRIHVPDALKKKSEYICDCEIEFHEILEKTLVFCSARAPTVKTPA